MENYPRYIPEHIGRSISMGLIAISLMGCVSTQSEAYYSAFTDQITYTQTPSPETVLHEETHKSRANSYPLGRVMWGIRYSIDPDFACQEEMVSNLESGIEPIWDHPACE